MGKGSKQNERKLKALEASYFSVDERSLQDLLRFTIQYSNHVSFYDFGNHKSGSWKPFFINDPLFIIALISGTDLQPFKKTHDALMAQLIEADDSQKIEIEKILAANILALARFLVTWRRLFEEAKYEGTLHKEIKNSFASVKSDLEIIISKQETDSKKAQRIYTIEDFGIIEDSVRENKEGILLSEGFKSVFKSMLFIKRLAAEGFEKELFEDSNHHPHIGLLIAFFKLFEEVQKDMNSFTQKHLDFYYQKILEQKPLPQKPISALIGIVPLSPKLDQYITPGQKVKFLFEDKREMEFLTSNGEWISQAKIADIKILFKSDYLPFSTSSIEDGTFLNILYDGNLYEGFPSPKVSLLNKENQAFQTVLGEDQYLLGSKKRTLWESDLGMGISSPVLIVEKGNLRVIVSISLTSDSWQTFLEGLEKFRGLDKKQSVNIVQSAEEKKRESDHFISKFLDNAFKLSFSADSGWLDLPDFLISFNRNKGETEIRIGFEINKNQPLPSIYDREIHGGDFDTSWPLLKLLINKEAVLPPYRLLKLLEMKDIAVTAEVKSVEKMTISNQLGDLDIGNPFQPFGPLPAVGSKLKVGSPYFLSKYLTKLDLQFRWSSLPLVRTGFTDYYKEYPYDYRNESFLAEISIQNGKTPIKHHQVYREFELFDTEFRNDGMFLTPYKSVAINLENFEVDEGPGLSAEERSRNELSIVLSLSNPPQAFGHQVYAELFAAASLKNSRFRRRKLPYPNQPYTPVLEHLLVDYTNYTKENIFRAKITEDVGIKVFQIFPFGEAKVYPSSSESFVYFMPQISHRGNLLLGLVDIRPNEVISLGFDLESSFLPTSAYQSPKLHWEYLDNNSWLSFKDMLLEDSTKNLIKSGIVKIKIPASFDLTNTRLPQEKFWIRIAYDGQTDLNSKIRHIFINAVRVNQNLDAGNSQPISGSGIKKMDIIGLKPEVNVFGAFGINNSPNPGIASDNYTRTSETLRHKNRASSTWDFERIVLDHFPEIQEVFVYGRSSFPHKLMKGTNLQVVVIPFSNPNLGLEGKRVSFESLIRIKEFLSSKVSGHARFEVSNAIYEKLKIRCSVKFQNFDTDQSNYYREILNKELVLYLSDSLSYKRTGSGSFYSIYKSEIVTFIETRPYVDFVTQFSVLKLVEVQEEYNVIDTAYDHKSEKIEVLETFSPYAVLTSAQNHLINIIDGIDNLPPKIASIGDLSINSDFVIIDRGKTKH